MQLSIIDIHYESAVHWVVQTNSRQTRLASAKIAHGTAWSDKMSSRIDRTPGRGSKNELQAGGLTMTPWSPNTKYKEAHKPVERARTNVAHRDGSNFSVLLLRRLVLLLLGNMASVKR